MPDLSTAKDILAQLRGRGRFSSQSQVYYVSSVTGSSSAAGTLESPISKIKNLLARLVSQSRSGKNDVVFVDQAHQEVFPVPATTTSAGLTISLAGLSIIGLADVQTVQASTVATPATVVSTFGRGPLFTGQCFAAANNGSGHTTITAQGVLLENLRFNGLYTGNAPTQVLLVDDGGAAATIRNCSFLVAGDAGTAGTAVNIGHANASYVVVEGCSIHGSPTGGSSSTNGILIASTPAGVVVRNNHIEGSFSSAGIRASGICLRARIYANDVQNTHATGTAILSGSTGTGRIYGNWVIGNTAITKGSMVEGDNTTLS